MKCPKCSLVTFDHLTRCPRCEASFAHARRLTRKRDPNRRIVLAGVQPSPSAETRDSHGGVPDAVQLEAFATPRPEPVAARETEAETPAIVLERAAREEPKAIPEVAVGRVHTAAKEEWKTRAPEAESTGVADETNSEPATVVDEVHAAPALDRRQRNRVRRYEDEMVTAAPASSASLADPEAVPGFATPEQHTADATHLKERMMLASRARRRRDAEMSAEPVDPVLPDWYEPTLNDDQAVTRRRVAGKSRN